MKQVTWNQITEAILEQDGIMVKALRRRVKLEEFRDQLPELSVEDRQQKAQELGMNAGVAADYADSAE